MLGYDHETDADFLKMRAREVALLGELQKLYPNHPIDTD
jgi:ssRNA-specific RNase YbeY (16S rRNA maturation enzyme)